MDSILMEKFRQDLQDYLDFLYFLFHLETVK
jgi:hypothetical protein